MPSLNLHAGTDSRTTPSLYQIQHIVKLALRLNLGKAEQKALLGHIFKNSWTNYFPEIKQEKRNDEYNRDGGCAPKECDHFSDSKRSYTLDELLHMPIGELVRLPIHEIHDQKEDALLLGNSLENLVQMKKEEATPDGCNSANNKCNFSGVK